MIDAAAFQQSAATEALDGQGSTFATESSLKTTGYVLSRQQAVALLQKLSTDDDFRTRYMASPGQGLIEIGVAAHVVSELEECLPPMGALADKSVFEAALTKLRLDQAEVYARYHPPTIRFKAP